MTHTLLVLCLLLTACASGAGQDAHAAGKRLTHGGHHRQQLTLQYRVRADAVAPSQFVAVYPQGMSMGLVIHWRLDDDAQARLDARLAELEQAMHNGAMFSAEARWIEEGRELEVYRIDTGRQAPP